MSYTTSEDGTIITGFTGAPVTLTIGGGIIGIGDNAFQNCNTLKTITFESPSIVTSIGNYAFYNSSLESIIIPSSVRSIGNNVFQACVSLHSITFESGSHLTSIGSFAFSNCFALISIIIPYGVTNIGQEVFYSCSSLNSVTIPSSVTSIGNTAFMSCFSLPSITIPSNVTNIGSYAFYGCSALLEASYYNINNRTTVGVGAFNSCDPNIVITIYTSLPPSCFPSGARIATATGYRAVETLKTGELVLTADNREVPIKVYRFTVFGTIETAPFKIPKNSIGPDMPSADLHLSPRHAFQLKKDLWHFPKYVVKQSSAIQQYDIGKKISYYHFECPNYYTDNLLVDGCVVESYGNPKSPDTKRPIFTYNKALKGFTRSEGPIASARSVRPSN